MNSSGKNTKQEQARAEAAGEIKRAKNILIGDTVVSRLSLKLNSIYVHTVEHTSKGKVVINRGMGYRGGENVFEGEQWVDIVQSPLETTPLVESKSRLT